MKLKNLISSIFHVDEKLSLEHRLFYSAVVVGMLTSTLGAFVNLIFLTSPVAVIIPLILSTFLALIFYLVKYKGIVNSLILPIIIIAQIGITFIWIKNGGIDGSNVMPGFVILVLSIIIVPKKFKKYILSLFLFLFCFVYLIQLYRPNLIIGYASERDRWIDSIVTLIYTSWFMYLIVRFLHNNYAIEKAKSEENERKFRKSEANLIEAQSIAHIGSWEWDMHSNFMEWSKEMYRVYDMSLDEFDGNPKTIIKVIHPDDVERFIREFYIKLCSGIQSSLEYRIIHKDGSIHYLYSEVNIEYNKNGQPCKSVGIVQDITNFKLIEEAKRKADDWARILSEAVKQSQISTVITDLSGNIEFINPKFTETTGYTEEEVIGENPRVLKSIDSTNTNYTELWNTILAGKTWKGIFHNKKKNGELYWESAIISPVKGDGKKITHFLGVKEDITNRIKAEKELRDSKQRYKILSNQLEAILDHIPGLIFYKDANNKYIRVNNYVAQQHGIDKKLLEGKSLYDLYPKADAEKYFKDDLSVIKSGESKLNIEETWQTEKGTTWLNTSKIPFVDSAGKINGVIGISMDISKRKLYEEQILKTNKILKELIAEKDKFFSIISHDLRSPFASLISLLELIVENKNDFSNNELDEFAASAYSMAKSTFHLLENLLEWSRLKRGVMPFSLINIDVDELFRNCNNSTKKMADKKQITLNMNVPVGLKVKADSNMLHSVIRNLVTNAIKFTPKGGWVKIKAQSYKNNTALISVADNGIGINAKKLNKLFLPNTNVSRPGTDGEPSSGLGLILCKEFVEKHGGKIWVESSEGIGSTFNFTVPEKQE